MLKLVYNDIVFQEVPGEVSLSLSFSGCPLRCPGCHSSELQDENLGKPFSSEDLQKEINKYKGLLTCVLFFGGDWQEEELLKLAKTAHSNNLKVCLYTGRKDVSDELKKALSYLKVGPYSQQRGPLGSPKTNQRFLKREGDDWINITKTFYRREKRWSNFHKNKS